MFENGSFGPLLDLSDLGVEALYEDLASIVNVLDNAIEFGAIELVKQFMGIEGAEFTIDWFQTEEVTEIITSIFGLNYLDVKKDDLVAFAKEMLPALGVLTEEDIAAIDFAADGEVIASLVERLMDTLALVDEDITTIDSLMAYLTTGMDMDKMLYLAGIVVDQDLLSVLHNLVETTLVNAGAKVAIEFVESGNMIPAQFAPIYDELNVTSEALVHDLGAILNIVEILVDFAGIDYINTGDVSFEGASEALSSVFDELFNLELIDHKFAEIIFAALEAFDIKLAFVKGGRRSVILRDGKCHRE
jgi:hypothetical protein